MGCKEPFAREENIIDELSSICNELITDLNEVEPGLQEAINKFTKMMKITHKSYNLQDMVGGYIKYALNEGSQFEKTRLIRNIHKNLSLHDKRLL